MEADLMREALRRIQAGLEALGHAPGPVDGLWGPRTRGAVLRLMAAEGGAATPDPVPGPKAPHSIRQGEAGHPVSEIVVHCSATRPNWMQGRSFADQVAEIRRWHVEDNRWRNIGYHWIVGRGGERTAGRPESAIGAHVVDRNQGTIGICLIGGHGSNERDRFADHFTPAQERALLDLVAEIEGRTAIERITGHNQYAARACPGFHVPSWLASQWITLNRRTAIAKDRTMTERITCCRKWAKPSATTA